MMILVEEMASLSKPFETSSLFRDNRRDYLTGYTLATIANLLVLIPQYSTTVRVILLQGPVQFPAVAYWLEKYSLSTSVFLVFLPSILFFQLVLAIGVVWTNRIGDLRRGWRWKFRILSMGIVFYVGGTLGLDFLNSLNLASIMSSLNMDIGPLLQTFYVFNLAAAICYFGLVLVMRRAYTRLSSMEAKDKILLPGN